MGKSPKTSRTFKEKLKVETGKEQDEDLNNITKMLTEEYCLAQNDKDRDDIVSINASKFGLGMTLWQKQTDGEIKLIAF